MEKLAQIVLDDADRASRLDEDHAVTEARRIEREAEEHLADMLDAAKALGRTRGEAADRALAIEADSDVERIHSGAFEALFERFLRQTLLALDGLPRTDAYRDALAAWARRAALVADGPVEVFCAKRDREAVYAALLAAGVEDFQVKVLRKHTVGFVVRDLDGRTVLDLRPEALVEAQIAVLEELLAARAPAFSSPSG